MTRLFLMVFVLAAALALAAPGGAQAPAPPAGKKAPEAPAVNPDLPVPPANYEYAGGGRRDPFISLVNRGVDPRGGEPAFRAEGVPGLMTSEITVRGILQSRGEWVAMVSGVDGKVYTIRAGAKLADGVVREVTAQAVVILQDVNDPLSLDKQREVRKFLRGGEEVK